MHVTWMHNTPKMGWAFMMKSSKPPLLSWMKKKHGFVDIIFTNKR